jgi:hypothetical protein
MRNLLKICSLAFCFAPVANIFAQKAAQTQTQLAAELSKMEKAWAEAKKQNGNAYSYKNHCRGKEFSTSVMITVKNGKATAHEIVNTYADKNRRYFAIQPKNYKQKRVTTIDELLQFARKTVLAADEKTFERTIEADENGLPLRVLATQLNNPLDKTLDNVCADGYTVSDIKFLPTTSPIRQPKGDKK